MKHLLPFVAGFIAFFILSGVYYMGIMDMPSGPCFQAEPDMTFGILANALFVALTAYVIQVSGDFSTSSGAKHGAIVALTANGFLNLGLVGMTTLFTASEAIQDIVVNIPLMAAAGAVMAILYNRGEAKKEA
jgi:hypothetical protein